MKSDDTSKNPAEPTAADLSAAESILAQMDDTPTPESPEYSQIRNAMARVRAKKGHAYLLLVYGLAEPRNRIDELMRARFRNEITRDEYIKECKAHVERPLDLGMLTAYCDEWHIRLQAYSDLLRIAIASATDQHNPQSWRRLEPEVDKAAARIAAKSGLSSEEIATVDRFLTEIRAGSAEPTRCGSFSAENAHMVARTVLTAAYRAWENCKETAYRSRTDRNYQYATTASSLFFHTCIKPGQRGTLPKPNDLAALMRLERVNAERVLRDRDKKRAGDLNRPAKLTRALVEALQQYVKVLLSYDPQMDDPTSKSWADLYSAHMRKSDPYFGGRPPKKHVERWQKCVLRGLKALNIRKSSWRDGPHINRRLNAAITGTP